VQAGPSQPLPLLLLPWLQVGNMLGNKGGVSVSFCLGGFR
jgi:hypothetical protein